MSSQLSPKRENLEQITRSVFKKEGASPQKRLGQNFLINQEVLQDILKASEIKSTDRILEIGAGSGILTEALIKKASSVIALEKDPSLVDFLKKKFSGTKVNIVNEDARDFLRRKTDWRGYKVVANLPFYLTSPLLLNLLSLEKHPSLIVVMIQKEVAERICAKPPKSNRLATICQFYGNCQIIREVKASDFWPKPKVAAAILKIIPSGNVLSKENIKLINASFASPRKTLSNNLSAHYKINRDFLAQLGFPPKIRAGELDKEQWLKLQKLFSRL